MADNARARIDFGFCRTAAGTRVAIKPAGSALYLCGFAPRGVLGAAFDYLIRLASALRRRSIVAVVSDTTGYAASEN